MGYEDEKTGTRGKITANRKCGTVCLQILTQCVGWPNANKMIEHDTRPGKLTVCY